jgi:hypothetical protein
VDGMIIWVYVHLDFEQSKEECEYLINLAKPHMMKSTVVDSKTGRSKDSRYEFPMFWFQLLFQIKWIIEDEGLALI